MRNVFFFQFYVVLKWIGEERNLSRTTENRWGKNVHLLRGDEFIKKIIEEKIQGKKREDD